MFSEPLGKEPKFCQLQLKIHILEETDRNGVITGRKDTVLVMGRLQNPLIVVLSMGMAGYDHTVLLLECFPQRAALLFVG